MTKVVEGSECQQRTKTNQVVVGSNSVSSVRRRLPVDRGGKYRTQMTMTRMWWEVTYVDD